MKKEKTDDKAAEKKQKKVNITVKNDIYAPYCITDGKKFKLKDIDPADTGHRSEDEKKNAKEALAEGVRALTSLQSKLYAQNKWGVLLIFQAMDAAGKDGCIRQVMSGINPQGCHVFSFKAPSTEELNHDYLWRCVQKSPERGHINIFNRSYYEEVLIARIHPNLLERQNIPENLITESVWNERYEDICNYEKYLCRNGFVILKFFLHVSKQEQKKRFMERLDDPEKNWKFSASDLSERARWDDYAIAYENMIRATATKHAPWYVVPADNKWFTHEVVSMAIVSRLSSLGLNYPEVNEDALKQLALARIDLMNEKEKD